MAEINFNNLYNQLNPMDRMFYDQQFKKSYDPNKENLRLSGQENYDQMKAVYDAQQQVPEKGFFDFFNFGEASAAEKPQVPDLTYRNITPTFDLATGITNTEAASPFINKFGITEQLMQFDPNNLKNKSIVQQIIENNQMKINQDVGRFLNVPRGTETISQATGVPGVVEPDGSFRMIPGYINRNNNVYMGNAASAKPINESSKIDLSNLINMGVANEPDVEQVKSLTEEGPSGIAKLFEFLNPLKGLGALSDKLKQSSMYRPSTTGVFGYTPAQLNQMNALGGYYSEPERERRRRANRISNMLQRAAEGKNYSEKNLSNLMNQFGMGDVDTGGMIKSIKESSMTGYGKGDVGLGSGGGRDYSSSPGAMAGDMEYDEE